MAITEKICAYQADVTCFQGTVSLVYEFLVSSFGMLHDLDCLYIAGYVGVPSIRISR